MKKIIIPAALALVLSLSLAVMAGGCGRRDNATGSQEPGEATEAAAPEDAGTEVGPEPNEGEASDLDQSVEALFASWCEHGVNTYACDECRYEVGVARAPSSLFESGLLHKAQPTREAVRVPLALTGEVRFDERRVAHLSSPAAGIVRRVPVAVGDRVRRGDTLVEIESGEAGAAAAELREAQSLLALAEERHERTRRLREQGIAAEKELRQTAQELESARIRLDASRAQVERLGASADAAGGVLRLRAPAAGAVLTLHAVGGEPARPDEVMATIGDVASVWVWADLYERDLSRLAAASAAGRSPRARLARAVVCRHRRLRRARRSTRPRARSSCA